MNAPGGRAGGSPSQTSPACARRKSSCARRCGARSNARSPESTGSVSKPWPAQEGIQQAALAGSSSTMRMRGPCRGLHAASLYPSGRARETQVGETEDGAARLVGQALDFPAVLSTICCTTARPSPVPFWLVVK